jgi:hypothetical protein
MPRISEVGYILTKILTRLKYFTVDFISQDRFFFSFIRTFQGVYTLHYMLYHTD